MALFRKRVSFPQFVADLISFQCDFLAANFDKLIALADELKALSKEDKEGVFDKAHSLLMVNLTMNCHQYFSSHVSQKEVGQGVGFLYEKYLKEFKQLPKTEVDRKIQHVMTLFDFLIKAEDDDQQRLACHEDIGYTSFPKIDDPAKAAQCHLCQAFAKYCVGGDVRAENWQGKHFATFKLAMGLVAGDIVGTALRQYKVTF